MNLFWQITAVEALLNVAIFAVAVIAYGVVRSRAIAWRWPRETEQVAVGLLLGGATAMATLVPLHLDGGAAIGCQAILIALSGTVSGGLATAVAFAIAEAAALSAAYLLGTDAPTTQMASFAAAALAATILQAVDRLTLPRWIRFRYVRLTRLALLSSLIALLALAAIAGPRTALDSAVAATAVNLAATFVLGTLLLHEQRRHDAEFDLRATASRLTDMNARLVAQAADLMLARDAAEQSSRAKSLFLRNMSHELRTPLNAVIGFAQLIQIETDPLHATCTEYARDIETGGQHLLSLITDILDFSKAEADELELESGEVALDEEVGICVRLMQPQAARNKVVLRFADSGRRWTVRGDERRVRQIVLNLLSNAVKFTPKDGTIDVRLEGGGDGSLTLVVADSGIGISEEDRERVFEPFFQVNTNLTREHEGTGLGLPLTKRLVELLHGRLEIESTPGKGTTVRVVFPPERIIESTVR
jgi:signal transduction histidine kinase